MDSTNNKQKIKPMLSAERIGALMKETTPVPTPIQEVTPVKKDARESQTQLMVWIDKELMKAVKRHHVENNMSIKEIVAVALKSYLAVKDANNH
jgi:hypothetical protein